MLHCLFEVLTNSGKYYAEDIDSPGKLDWKKAPVANKYAQARNNILGIPNNSYIYFFETVSG